VYRSYADDVSGVTPGLCRGFNDGDRVRAAMRAIAGG
jgi:hypothetical protein